MPARRTPAHIEESQDLIGFRRVVSYELDRLATVTNDLAQLTQQRSSSWMPWLLPSALTVCLVIGGWYVVTVRQGERLERAMRDLEKFELRMQKTEDSTQLIRQGLQETNLKLQQLGEQRALGTGPR